MSGAQGSLKKRLIVMGTINALAVAGAGALLVSYFKLGQGWALPGFIVAMGVGFAAQIWFILGLRGQNFNPKDSAREARGGGRA